ncbi:MAG TPA: ATP-binding protein [Gemmatimonadales bacterium]|nr:ATP-binding protein [Gemmatimonadales bacterium]
MPPSEPVSPGAPIPAETSEERYRAFIEQTSEGVWRCDLRRPIDIRLSVDEQIDRIYADAWLAECNNAMARMYGLDSADQIVGVSIEQLLPREDPANVEYLSAFIRSGYRLSDAESHEVGRNGESYYFLNNLVGIVREGLLIRAWGSQRDITARKAIESALRDSEERYRALVMASSSLVWTSDAQGRFATPQPSWEGYTGQPWAEHRDFGWIEALHPEDREAVRRSWQRRVREPRLVHEDHARLWSVEKNAYRHIVGRAVPVLDGDGAVREWIGTVTDVEERRQAEDRLRRAERMETVGRLAGGIAHEANNQMSVILGSAQFVLRRRDIPDVVREDVEHIHRAAERTAGITQQLLAFSRRQVLQPQVLDLNALVQGAEPILRRTLGERSGLVVRAGTPLGRIKADPGQLEQVLLNLVLNARDAMPDGGTVSIETSNATLTSDYAALKGVATIAPGPHVLLAVSDTGAGMDLRTAGRAFEPFFTTKPTGEGTGLGLATVYGIVKQSGGYVWLYSEPGQGTAVKIYLPVVGGAPAGKARRDSAPMAVEGETVLLVEDEPSVRAVMGRVLREQGYAVLDAPHGRSALAIAADPATRIDLVVADVVMPELGGRELAARLSEQRPGVPILFISGYTGHDVVERGLIERDWPFLAKPVAPDALARKVRELLDRD